MILEENSLKIYNKVKLYLQQIVIYLIKLVIIKICKTIAALLQMKLMKELLIQTFYYVY